MVCCTVHKLYVPSVEYRRQKVADAATLGDAATGDQPRSWLPHVL